VADHKLGEGRLAASALASNADTWPPAHLPR